MATDLVIFAGPTLYGCNIQHLPGEAWLSPASQGDILSACLMYAPRKILLIDGSFYQTLSVWTKEIVYALLEGIVVIGASSMGALRAAELHRYGMIGVGKIFERYRDGEEDDSLVAMSYDPATYRPLTEAPIGQDLKRADALEALKFARGFKGHVKTSLSRSAITPYLRIVMERILG